MSDAALRPLDALVGVWEIEPRISVPGAEGIVGRTVFEWMPGGRLLIQRWEVPHPDAPDGLAIIGSNPDRDGYLQHYFDSRGVVRLYAMTLRDGVWGLLRTQADFSPLEPFAQRFTGHFSADGRTIEGRWEKANDGATWELDFELVYTKAGP